MPVDDFKLAMFHLGLHAGYDRITKTIFITYGIINETFNPLVR